MIVDSKGREVVPVDEGETEAQFSRPVVTIRLGPSPDDGREFPRDVTFEVPTAGLRKAAMDAVIHEHAVAMLTREGLRSGEPAFTATVTAEGRVRRAVYPITGYQEDPDV